MLKSFRSNLCALSIFLFTMPNFAFAEPEMCSDSEHVEGHFTTSRFPATRKLCLKDLAGEWVFRSTSIGGISGSDTVGTSVVIDGQVTIDKEGLGQVNFGSVAIYRGTPGDIETFTINPDVATITITITDPVHWVGTMAITNLGRNFNATVDFIAIKSEEGKAIKLIGHRTSASIEAANITSYTFERQVQ